MSVRRIGTPRANLRVELSKMCVTPDVLPSDVRNFRQTCQPLPGRDKRETTGLVRTDCLRSTYLTREVCKVLPANQNAVDFRRKIEEFTVVDHCIAGHNSTARASTLRSRRRRSAALSAWSRPSKSVKRLLPLPLMRTIRPAARLARA